MVEHFIGGGSCASRWVNGRRVGKTEWLFKDGTKYVGTMTNAIMTKDNKKLFDSDGELYSGDGKLTDANGNVVFEGKWKNTEEVTKIDGSKEKPFRWPPGIPTVSGNNILFFKKQTKSTR